MSWRVGVGHFESSVEIRDEVADVLNSGRLSYGPKSRALEKRFAEMHGREYGVLSNSGTSSLQVALQACKELFGWNDGDEVIIPAVTFVATANIVLHNNMIPVLADVDPKTYNIDPLEIHRALSPRTRAVIPVHLFGQPANMSGISSVLPAKTVIIEDSCEAVLATHRGRSVGSWGHVGCFSFYVAHHLTAGVGGMAITNDHHLANYMRSLVNHGRQIKHGGDMDIGHSDDVRRGRFAFERVGHSYRITELEAAVALGQLEHLSSSVALRNEVAYRIWGGLSRLKAPLQLPWTDDYSTHSFMMFPIVLEDRWTKRDKWHLCRFLEKRGIETREMLPLTNQPVYDGMFDEGDYPVAKAINKRGFYIGCHPGVTFSGSGNDVDYIVSVFGKYFNG